MNLNAMTIPQLKTYAAELGLTVASKLRKAEIVALIEAEEESRATYDLMEADAADMDAMEAYDAQISALTQDAPKVIDIKAAYAELDTLMAIENQVARAQTYVAQRGTYKLTAAQWRRIRKHNRKHSLITGIDNTGKVTVNSL